MCEESSRNSGLEAAVKEGVGLASQLWVLYNPLQQQPNLSSLLAPATSLTKLSMALRSSQKAPTHFL